MPQRGPEAGILCRQDHFHGSGVNRIDSSLFTTSKFSFLMFPPDAVALPPRFKPRRVRWFFKDHVYKTPLKSPRGRPIGGGDIHRILEVQWHKPTILPMHTFPIKKQ